MISYSYLISYDFCTSIQAKWRFSPKSELNFSGIFSRTWDVRAAAVRVGWHGNQQFRLRKMRESVHRNHWKALQKRPGRLCEFWADEFCRQFFESQRYLGLNLCWFLHFLDGCFLTKLQIGTLQVWLTYTQKTFFLQVILFRSVWRVSTRRNFKLQSSPAGEEPGGGKPCGSWGKATFTGTELCTTWSHLSVATPLAKWSKWETFPGDTKRNMVIFYCTVLCMLVKVCMKFEPLQSWKVASCMKTETLSKKSFSSVAALHSRQKIRQTKNLVLQCQFEINWETCGIWNLTSRDLHFRHQTHDSWSQGLEEASPSGYAKMKGYQRVGVRWLLSLSNLGYGRSQQWKGIMFSLVCLTMLLLKPGF